MEDSLQKEHQNQLDLIKKDFKEMVLATFSEFEKKHQNFIKVLMIDELEEPRLSIDWDYLQSLVKDNATVQS